MKLLLTHLKLCLYDIKKVSKVRTLDESTFLAELQEYLENRIKFIETHLIEKQ